MPRPPEGLDRRRLTNMTEIVLDPYGENLAAPGVLEVRDDVTFLKNVNSGALLFIQGHALCAWAAEVARARGWNTSWLAAPSVELRQACPSLSVAEAKTFILR